MKPALFNTEMVKALLDGRKSVTRRVVKPQPKSRLVYTCMGSNHGAWCYPSKTVWESWGEEYRLPGTLADADAARHWNPPYHSGDILYVRETWVAWSRAEGLVPKLYYKADGNAPDSIKWKPSIHMPKEAARIFLRVTGVWVEHLQDMRMGDMKAEGMIPTNVSGGSWQQWQRDYAKPAWNSTIKKSDLPVYGWDANPWVWVIEFERISAEEARSENKL